MTVDPSRSTPVAADRGASSVGGRNAGSNTGRYVAMTALILVGGTVIAYFLLQGEAKKPEGSPKSAAGSQMEDFVAAPAIPVIQNPTAPMPPSPAMQTGAASADKYGLPFCPPGQPGCSPPKPDAMKLARESPVLIYSRGSPSSAAPAEKPAAETIEFPHQPEKNELQARLNPTVLTATQASELKNRDLMLAQGSVIECILERAIDSTLPGLTSCSVPRDILSDNGRVILLEKGTQIVGEFQGGLRQGQRRIFVLWTRAKTPQGAIINLASPASDALGQTGFDGQIDNHFWDRFGAALVLSIVGDATATAGQIAENSASSGTNGTTIQTSGMQSAGKQGAAIAVENSANIPPTLYKNQGEIVAVQLARDLDFSTVYLLELNQ